MKRLNLKFEVKNLKGEPILSKDQNTGLNKQLAPINIVVAEALFQTNSGVNAIKITEIARKLFIDGFVDLDTQDVNLIEEEIKKLKFVNAILTPILKAIGETRMQKDKKEEVKEKVKTNGQ